VLKPKAAMAAAVTPAVEVATVVEVAVTPAAVLVAGRRVVVPAAVVLLVTLPGLQPRRQTQPLMPHVLSSNAIVSGWVSLVHRLAALASEQLFRAIGGRRCATTN